VKVAALVMIVFGVAEIITSFTHNFFGISIAPRRPATLIGAAIGACYCLAGLLVLPGKKSSALFAIAFLAIVILGRIALVSARLFPVDSFKQVAAISVGSLIAAGFAAYIVFCWPSLG
jgi:hypothetical protein